MYSCDLNIHGIRVRIRTRKQEEIRRLESFCGLFLVPIGPEPESGAELTDEDELDLLSFLARHDIFAFHAAAYQNGSGKGILLPGGAASGKTTIAFSALSSGYPFVSDDVTLCRQEGKDFSLLPFKTYLNLKQDGRGLIYNVLEHYPKDVFGSTHAWAVVFPEIVTEDESSIQRVDDRRTIFAGLLKTAVWVGDNVLRRRQASVLEGLCSLPAYSLFLGNDHKRRPQLAIELLDRI